MNFFDLHCDTPYECYKQNEKFYVNRLAVSGKGGERFDNWKQVFAVWIKDDVLNPWRLYKDILNNFKEKLRQKPENLTPYFAVEGGAVIENDIDRLYALKQDGISLLTLTWNGENTLAGGVDSQKGLTAFGKKVIKEMNRLKIGCDLSHINEKGFFEAIETADFPLATHSNCKEICFHKRNLTLEQIKLIAEKKGVIGLCFYPSFLGENVYDKIYQNIFYLCDKGFENNIAIGSDFDGAEMDKKLDNISKIPHLYNFLKCRGLKKELLYKIFYKNADNFIAKLSKNEYYNDS